MAPLDNAQMNFDGKAHNNNKKKKKGRKEGRKKRKRHFRYKYPLASFATTPIHK